MTMIVIIMTMIVILMTMIRCATGEAWPDIMLAGIGGRPCDPKSYNRLKMMILGMLMMMMVMIIIMMMMLMMRPCLATKTHKMSQL